VKVRERLFLHLNCSTGMQVGKTVRSTEIPGYYSGNPDPPNFIFFLLLKWGWGKQEKSRLDMLQLLLGESTQAAFTQLRRKYPGSFHTAPIQLRAWLQGMQCNAVKGSI